MNWTRYTTGSTSTYDCESHDRCYRPLFQTHSILSLLPFFPKHEIAG